MRKLFLFSFILISANIYLSGAKPFENSNFEKGTFENWPVHENWSVVDPGSQPGIPPKDRKIDVLGLWGASSIYRMEDKFLLEEKL